MRKIKLVFAILFVVVVALLSSCESSPDRRFETLVRNVQDEKFNLQVRYLPAEELNKRSAPTQSPFISPSRFIDTREFVVFEVTIKNKTELPTRFELRNIQLKLGAGIYDPKNAFQMKRYWEQYDLKGSDRDRMEKQLDQYLFDREVSIPSNGLKRGWIVFNPNLPKYGEMVLALPLFSSDFRPDIYEFNFAFTNFN